MRHDQEAGASVSRRSSFELATAVGTLAAGLGVTFVQTKASAADAEPIEPPNSKTGGLTAEPF